MLLVLPSVLLVASIFFVPLVLAVWISLHDWPLLGASEFVGLANYQRALSDPELGRALWFTLRYTALAAPLTIAVGYGLAVLIRRPIRAIGVFRTLFFLPFVVGMAAACYMFTLELHPYFGVFSAIAQDLGIANHPVNWLLSADSAIPTVAVISTWKTVGFAMVILMAGMQAVPQDILDAAKVDGAGRLATEFHVILPLIRRSLILVLIITVIGCVLTFDQFFILTRGGPQMTTETAVVLIYETAFPRFQVGYASAMSVLVLVGLLVATGAQLRLIRGAAEL